MSRGPLWPYHNQQRPIYCTNLVGVRVELMPAYPDAETESHVPISCLTAAPQPCSWDGTGALSLATPLSSADSAAFSSAVAASKLGKWTTLQRTKDQKTGSLDDQALSIYCTMRVKTNPIYHNNSSSECS